MGRIEYDYLVKLLLVGDSGCGKSNMLLKYSDGVFSPSFITTIGIDFKIKNITINDKKIKVQIWDTAGQERFRTITTAYYRGAMGIMVIYDITDIKSFNNVNMWLRNVNEHSNNYAKLMLIGNKSDCIDLRQVSTEQGMQLAYEYNLKNEGISKIEFMEVSAKEGTNIEEAYSSLINRVIVDLVAVEQENNKDVVKLSGGKPDKKKRKLCNIL
jgi:small GTP-binding protein